MKKKILLVTAVIISSHSYAQRDSTTMDEVVVTATKTEIKQSQTGKVVTIINQASLQASAGKSLVEILNAQVGLFISGANNNRGSNQDYYIRGAATGNTLILIDGVPVADPSYISSYFDLNNINPNQVERIEILKGAQSTLWGSDAVAGVINIITKKSNGKKFSPNLSMAYGSYQTLKLDAGVDGSLKKLQYNLQYGYTNSKGFSSAYDSSAIAGFDRDKFSQQTIHASLGYNVSQKNTIKISSNFGLYQTGLDAAPFADDADYTNKNTSFINSFTFTHKGKKGTWNFLNSYISTKRQLMDDSASIGGFSVFTRGHYSGNTLVNELYGNISLSKKLSLLTGLQRMQSSTSQSYYSISSWGPYETALGDSAKTTNYAAYASVSLLQYHRFNAEAGLRMNHHSIYGKNMTRSFNPSFNINAHARIFINLSSAYRVPSLYQLYSEYGNKDLQPEKSNNYEIGIQSSLGASKNMVRLVAFKRDIKQVIIFYTDANTYESKYLNKDMQHDYGFEWESSIGVGKTGKWVTNLTYVDGEGKTDDVKIKNLYRRPNFTANSSLSLEPKKGWMLMPSVRFVGKRLKGEYDFGPAEMPQYYTIDFFSSYQMSKCFRVFADWRNISNQRYFDIPGYNCRMSNITLGIRASL